MLPLEKIPYKITFNIIWTRRSSHNFLNSKCYVIFYYTAINSFEILK